MVIEIVKDDRCDRKVKLQKKDSYRDEKDRIITTWIDVPGSERDLPGATKEEAEIVLEQLMHDFGHRDLKPVLL